MTRKNTLKRAMMYVVVLVSVVFVGFMAFYFAKNNETIALTIEEGSIVYMNKGDVIALPLLHEDPHRGTTFEATYSTEGIATVSFDLMTVTANAGGAATITITPSNTKFGPFRFDVVVGEGTSQNPWYVSNAAQLSSIGKPAAEGKTPWTIYQSYELISDINLNTTYTQNTFWQTIPEFHGTISGEGHTISNLKVVGSSVNLGMFGTISQSARIENVHFTNTYVEAIGSTYVGTIAGINKGFIGKVSVNGTLISTGENSTVGGVVGFNKYEGGRPILNMVSSNLSISALGTVGGLVGNNLGGIIFNSSAITTLDVYMPVLEEPVEPEPLATIAFGGAVATNSAVIYGDAEEFRQAAIKNVFVLLNADALIARNALYKPMLALVTHTNTELGDHTYAASNVFTKIYAVQHQELPKFVSANGASVNDINLVTTAQAANSETFDLGSAWTYDINTHTPAINFSASYQPTLVSEPGQKITDAGDIAKAFKNIVQNMNKSISYTVDASKAPNQEMVVDIADIMTELNYTTWQPIGTLEQPYKGQIIVEGGTLVLENLTIENNNSPSLGFFGFVSGPNTILKNIKLRNVSITATNPISYVGAFVAFMESGYIENLSVDNVTITNAQHAGFAVGYNQNGILSGIKVGEAFADGQENLITYTLESGTTLYYGGVVGVSAGTVKDSTVSNIVLKNEHTAASNMGGLIGKMLNNAVLASSSNQSAYINSYAENGYYGGLVGYMNAKTTVQYSYNLGDILVTIGDNGESYAGGIAGYVGENAIIKTSFSHTLSIQAENVGGIAGMNYGSIRESYSLGDYIGKNVGGLAYYNKGEIRHSYTRATVKSIGTSDKDTAAGLVVFIPKGGKIQFVYSSASIQAPNGAKKFAETRSYIRYTGIESFVDGLFGGSSAGSISNYIVINYSDAIVQSDNFNAIFRGIGLADLPKDFIQTDEDAVLGYGAVDPFAIAGFQPYTPQYWVFEDGQWPTLVNVVANPLEQAETQE